MTDDIPLDEHLSERQYRLLRDALGYQLDWHHSVARPEIVAEYRESLQILDLDEADQDGQ